MLGSMPARFESSLSDIGPGASSNARISLNPTSIDWMLRFGLPRILSPELPLEADRGRTIPDAGFFRDRTLERGRLAIVALTKIISRNIALLAELLRRPR